MRWSVATDETGVVVGATWPQLGLLSGVAPTDYHRLLDGMLIDDSQLFRDKLQEWEDYYNYHRPHGGLGGQTPIESSARRPPLPKTSCSRSTSVAQKAQQQGRAANTLRTWSARRCVRCSPKRSRGACGIRPVPARRAAAGQSAARSITHLATWAF
jgi:Integrase core domain